MYSVQNWYTGINLSSGSSILPFVFILSTFPVDVPLVIFTFWEQRILGCPVICERTVQDILTVKPVSLHYALYMQCFKLDEWLCWSSECMKDIEKFIVNCELSRLLQELIGSYIMLEEYFMREMALKVSHCTLVLTF